MPNWCENDLTITGNKDDLTALVAFVAGEDTALDFNKVLPMPSEFDGLRSGPTTINGKRYSMWREAEEDGKKVSVGVEDCEIATWVRKYGSAGWYDWAIANWGTKWNTKASVSVSSDGTCTEFSFSTAWSPPVPVILTLIEKFPTLDYNLEYFEGGGGFCGGVTFDPEFDDSPNVWEGSYNGRRGG